MHCRAGLALAITTYMRYRPGEAADTSGAQVFPGCAQVGRVGRASEADTDHVFPSREVASWTLAAGLLVAYA